MFTYVKETVLFSMTPSQHFCSSQRFDDQVTGILMTRRYVLRQHRAPFGSQSRRL
jgi:flavorubredoxin